MTSTILCRCTLCKNHYYIEISQRNKKQKCPFCFDNMIPEDYYDFYQSIQKCKRCMC
jgi:hypothetical protein